MVTTLLNLFYPATKNMDDESVDNAIQLAENYRPECLKGGKQDEAVAWYAAYLLAQSVENDVNPLGLKREREGDLEREFGSASSGGNAAKFIANYERLAEVCRRVGAITVGGYGNSC
ncbi:DUF4054 domain-containing protein [Pasteurella caecimuris]|uniref:DUF4054 domain-containing protein n=1 Tax=Rodentibacter caecimuris TaxID=1796644 RepID=UPI00215054B7|nr:MULTISPECIES: DUF4054 domain-containing protein [Pasteurellaceae]MCR1838602.1 DUF4054 domain-containing protein [Pasteurella caecimuris]MCU0107899.1 DUF4054 domain-containing protein [Pasteurella caecimuris]MCX2960299.1 DUF4054 domain-containing protein [Rodentibacter heylii]